MASGDRIEADTRALCRPQGRRVGQPGHETARRYVRERLAGIGLEPFAGDAFVFAFLRELDGAPIDGGALPHDPADFEIRTIERAMGPALPGLLAMLGLGRLAGRADIQTLATALAGSLRRG